MLAYAAVLFVLLQAAEIVLPAFLPGFRAEAVLRVLVVAGVLALPVVLALAWVYEITPKGIRATSTMDAEAGAPNPGRLMPRLAFLLVTMLAAGGAGLWWYRTDTSSVAPGVGSERPTPFITASTTDASGPIASLAVLPLENFSPASEGEQDYFVAGMHEALISQISQLGPVRVISRTTTVEYGRVGKSLPQIGAELGVDAVVEGSVLRADGKVRITVQLIHAASDTHLWARDYERDFADVIGLQREVAEAIASEIGAQIADREVDASASDDRSAASDVSPGTPRSGQDVPAVAEVPAVAPSPEVQDAFMRGRFALSRGSDESMDEAMDRFDEALELDPTFTPALVGLAGGHLLLGLQGDVPALDELLVARRLARQALEQEPGSAEATEVLASVEQALASYGERVSARARNDVAAAMRVTGLAGDSMLLVMDGDSMRVPRVSVAPMLTEFGGMLQTVLARSESGAGAVDAWLRGLLRLEAAGHVDRALSQAAEGVELYPESESVYAELERLQASAGDFTSAVATRSLREDRFGPGPGPDARALADAVRRSPYRGYWTWLLEDLRARREAGDASVSAVHEAEAFAALGRPDQALIALERARDERDARLVSLRANPVWDELRADERFRDFLRSLMPARSPSSLGRANG